MEQTLDISWKSIVKVLCAGLLFYVLFLARDVVIWFFFALVISLLIEPAVNALQWLRLPRVVSVVLVYLFILAALGSLIYLCAPIFIFEINQFSQNIPEYFEKLNPILKNIGIGVEQNFQDFTANLLNKLQESSGSIVKSITVFFGGIYSTFIIFTLAFFTSLENRGTEKILSLFIPPQYESSALDLFDKAKIKVSGWFGARLLSCLFVGLTSFAVFFLLGVKYAFILALLSGVLNFVPYVGPTVTLVFSVVFVGVSNSWMYAGYIFIALLVIQEVENKLLTPLLMKKFMDLPPVLVLMSLLVGGALFGFLGTLFVVPVFGILYEFSKDFLESRKQQHLSV